MDRLQVYFRGTRGYCVTCLTVLEQECVADLDGGMLITRGSHVVLTPGP